MALTDQQHKKAALVLYRVYLYISNADARGIWSKRSEKKSLYNALKKFKKHSNVPPFIQEIIKLTLCVRANSKVMSNLDDVPSECEKLVNLLNSHCKTEEILKFKELVMTVAFRVAEANWETEKGELTPYDAIWGNLFLGNFLGRIFFTFATPRQIFWDFMRNSNPLFRLLSLRFVRISYLEDQALAKISSALAKDIVEEDIQDFLAHYLVKPA